MDRLLQAFDDLCADRADLRVISWILGPDRVREWIMSVGVCREDKLRALIPPLPPIELRQIVAAPEPEIFLWTGFVDSRQVGDLNSKYGGLDSPRILDFGCGCGRMLRFLGGACGCDINPALVQWCRANLDADVRLNGPRPPLPFDSRSFDLVYCLSLFTHLPEHLAQPWLEEIHRVLAPGGLAILTTHGVPALRIITESKAHQDMFGMSPQAASEIIENFEDRPFVFTAYDAATLQLAKAGDEYGNAFISRNYVERCWGAGPFECLEHLPHGLRGWQDITVLRS